MTISKNLYHLHINVIKIHWYRKINVCVCVRTYWYWPSVRIGLVTYIGAIFFIFLDFFSLLPNLICWNWLLFSVYASMASYRKQLRSVQGRHWNMTPFFSLSWLKGSLCCQEIILILILNHNMNLDRFWLHYNNLNYNYFLLFLANFNTLYYL